MAKPCSKEARLHTFRTDRHGRFSPSCRGGRGVSGEPHEVRRGEAPWGIYSPPSGGLLMTPRASKSATSEATQGVLKRSRGRCFFSRLGMGARVRNTPLSAFLRTQPIGVANLTNEASNRAIVEIG